MKNIISTIILGLFLASSFSTAAEKKEPTQAEKKQWAADAEKYERMVHALGGKMAEAKEKPKATTDLPQTKTDIRPKL